MPQNLALLCGPSEDHDVCLCGVGDLTLLLAGSHLDVLCGDGGVLVEQSFGRKLNPRKHRSLEPGRPRAPTFDGPLQVKFVEAFAHDTKLCLAEAPWAGYGGPALSAIFSHQQPDFQPRVGAFGLGF